MKTYYYVNDKNQIEELIESDDTTMYLAAADTVRCYSKTSNKISFYHSSRLINTIAEANELVLANLHTELNRELNNRKLINERVDKLLSTIYTFKPITKIN